MNTNASLPPLPPPPLQVPHSSRPHISTQQPLQQRPKWRKLLYIRQDYPDNYVDNSFLKQMKKNVNVRQLSYWDVVSETFRVSQQLSVIMVFVAVFIHLHEGVVLFFTMLLGLTPILKNLTKDISTDSIWFMTILMLLANLLFHDYGSSTSTHTRFPDSLSINAGMFASVLLASQLKSNVAVFSLLLVAVQLFALFPILRRSLRAWYHPWVAGDASISGMLIAIGIALIWPISHVVVFFYSASMVFVTFFCPYLLVSIQKYKSEIRGPWDEAVIVTNK
ncbi:phosphatidylinositol N-acetylglucosaminyltransferase subunit C [Entophlyctis helioformis]|nr:phosphatidylinositol N-acetylglucosaminyltransferase subunit C [Entophlyctis helioformis]